VPARLAGKTTWNTRGLLTLAINGITGFSAKPLVLVFRFGLIGIILSLALAIQALWSWATHSAISGWTSLTIVSVFFGSANLLAIGVLGSYLAQLFDEIKARPPYLIASRVGKQSQEQTIHTYLQTTNKQALPRIKKHL